MGLKAGRGCWPSICNCSTACASIALRIACPAPHFLARGGTALLPSCELGSCALAVRTAASAAVTADTVPAQPL